MTGAAAGGGGPGSTRRAAVGKAGGRSRSAQPRAAAGGGSGGGSEEEEQRDGGSLFLVNKSGFPMDGQTWERMWGHVERVHPDGGAVAAAIRSAVRLARPSVPPVPNYKLSMSIPEWLQAIQTYMKMLQLMETAKEMTRESLPIKCLEAVILGMYPFVCLWFSPLHHFLICCPSQMVSEVVTAKVHTRYLTNGQPSVERFPISFKTHFSGNYFHHVVLGIYCNGRYGSLGMSRRSDLMDKPLTYRTLSDLIFDFEDSYKKYLHSVKKVKIGLYVPHEPHSFQPIEWKQLVLNVSKMMRTEVRKELEKFARDMRMKVGLCTGELRGRFDLSHPAEIGLAPCRQTDPSLRLSRCLAEECLLRSNHVPFWLRHLPLRPDLEILKPSSAHSPMKERSRGKSLSPRRRQASPQRRACKRDKSPAVVDKKGDLATLNEVGYQLRI
ncbi:Vash2 [Columba livia]|nr:Vash2 [Columba livia]